MDHTTMPSKQALSRAIWRRSAPLVIASVAVALLTACGSSDSSTSGSRPALSAADVSQTVEFTATEYKFAVDSSTQIEPGEVVRFRLTNIGGLDHEMRVLDGNGRLIDQIDRLAPGESGEVLVSFDEAGQYQLICDIDDHLTQGQRSVFSINEPVNEPVDEPVDEPVSD